jgi:restriction endonuclease S subunit
MPDGWVQTTIGQVADINPESANRWPRDKVIRYVDLSSVSAAAGISSAAVATYAFGEAPGRARRIVRKEDVLVSTVRPYLRGFALVGDDLDGQIASTGFAVLRARPDRLIPGYLWACVTTDEFVDGLMARATGTNYPAVRPGDVAAQPIMVPPIAEQRRIVDLIGAAGAAIEAARKYRTTAESALNALNSRLMAATDESEPEATLGDIADYQNGYPFKPSELGRTGLPVVRIKQLLDPTETMDRSETPVPSRNHVADGDLIFSWSGTLAVKFWDRGPALLNQHLFRVVERPGVDRHWLRFALEHAITELEKKTHGTTMRHITKADLLPHPVNLPSLEEQRRVADLLDAAEATAVAAGRLSASLNTARGALLGGLLAGDRQVPESYDQLMVGAA